MGYWVLLTMVPVPGEGVAGLFVLGQPARTITAHVDRALFDWTRFGLGNHLWDSALTWDPEGLLSTLPSVATVLLGVLCGRWMLAAPRQRRVRDLVIVGLAAILVGWLWGFVFPINKSLWTSSFVVFTAGVGAVLLALLSAVLDDRAQGAPAPWALPLLVFGANPLIAYAGSELARRILHSSIKLRGPDGRLGLDEWVTHHLQAAGLPPNAASLAWALVFVAAWWIGRARLSRRQLFVRV
jgi:predicted acyltransferase